MPHCMILHCNFNSTKKYTPQKRYEEENNTKVGFFNLPKVVTNQCALTKELSTLRRSLWLDAIGRSHLTDYLLNSDNGRVCSRHFVSGKSAKLFDQNNIDWVPTLHLECQKFTGKGTKKGKKSDKCAESVTEGIREIEKNSIHSKTVVKSVYTDDGSPDSLMRQELQCCVKTCAKTTRHSGSRSDSEGSSDEESELKRQLPRTFIRFPPNQIKESHWCNLIGRPGFKPSMYSMVCSDHFSETDLIRDKNEESWKGAEGKVKRGALPYRKLNIQTEQICEDISKNEDDVKIEMMHAMHSKAKKRKKITKFDNKSAPTDRESGQNQTNRIISSIDADNEDEPAHQILRKKKNQSSDEISPESETEDSSVGKKQTSNTKDKESSELHGYAMEQTDGQTAKRLRCLDLALNKLEYGIIENASKCLSEYDAHAYKWFGKIPKDLTSPVREGISKLIDNLISDLLILIRESTTGIKKEFERSLLTDESLINYDIEVKQENSDTLAVEVDEVCGTDYREEKTEDNDSVMRRSNTLREEAGSLEEETLVEGAEQSVRFDSKQTSSSVRVDEKNTEIDLDEMVEIGQEENKFQCDECHKKFPTQKMLDIHNTRKLSSVQNCVVCEAALTKVCGLQMHSKVHADELNLVCKGCGKNISSARSLNDHLKCKVYKCKVCDSAFDKPCLLQTHMKQIHLDQRYFPCSICKVVLVSKETFDNHMRSHKIVKDESMGWLTKFKFHLCDVCGKNLKSKESLKYHYLLKHKNAIYNCKICQKSFTIYKYQRHMAKHRRPEKAEFLCQHCGAQFFRACDLKCHHFKMHVARNSSAKSKAVKSEVLAAKGP